MISGPVRAGDSERDWTSVWLVDALNGVWKYGDID